MTVDPTGLITFESISDSSLIGTHVVEITAQQYPATLKILNFTVEIKPSLSVFDGQIFKDELTERVPIATEDIASTYRVHFGETALFSFYFANPKLFDTSDSDGSDIAGINIKLIDRSTLPGVVAKSSDEYEKVGVGKITLVVDG